MPICILILGTRIGAAVISQTNYYMSDANLATCNLLPRSTSLLSHQRIHLPHITTTGTNRQVEVTISGFYLRCEKKQTILSVLNRIPVEGHEINLYKTSMSRTCYLNSPVTTNQGSGSCVFICQCDLFCTLEFMWKTGKFSYQHNEMAICDIQMKEL